MDDAVPPKKTFDKASERKNYNKLCILVNREGTDVVRGMFDSLVPPQQLLKIKTLYNPEVQQRLHILRTQGFIKSHDWHKLFPIAPGSFDSTFFDIPFLVALLMGICDLALPSKEKPNETDLSLGADLMRILEYYNIYTPYNPEGEISDEEFECLWKKVKSTILRILGRYAPSKVSECEIYTDKSYRLPKSLGQDQLLSLISRDRHVFTETVPAEIRARGSEALKAYEEALKNGKTKNQHFLVTVIGPSRTGKTSLLRTLKGQEFVPDQDSTTGVVLQKAFCKPRNNSWCEEDSDKDHSFNSRMANFIAESLNSNTSQSIAEEPVTETDAPSYPAPTIARDISPDGSQTRHTHLEDSSSSYDDDEYNSDQMYLQVDNSPDDSEESIWVDVPMKEQSTTEKLKLMAEMSEILHQTKNLLAAPLQNKSTGPSTNEKDIFFKTLGFAGQQVYEVLLPLFMSSQSIYILVYSLENDLLKQAQPKVKHGNSERELENHFGMTNLETVEFWLTCISSYTKKGTDSAGRTRVTLPPVFVACTHEDKCKQNPKEVARELCKRLTNLENPCGKHVVPNVYTVNNTLSGNKEIQDKSAKRLKADIEELSKDLPQMDEYIPLNWLKFEKELSNLVENEQKKYIDLEEARRIAKKCNINPTVESKEFATLLNYLHDVKTIIYFEETGTVFIDTQWLINMLVKVITVLPFEEWKDYADYWRKLEDEGVLQRALVEHVWKDIADDGQNTVDSLLLIMEKFSLICRWRLNEEEVFLVPCMLCNSARSEDIEMFLADPKSSTMVIHFKSVHLPLGIFPRLFVAIAEHAKKEWRNVKQPKLRPNFCRIFKVGDKGMLDICITSGIRIICVSVCNKNNLDDESVTQFCQSVRKLLAQIFDDLCPTLPSMENIEFEYGIRCPVCTNSRKKCNIHKMEGCTRDSCLHFVSEEELKDDRPECREDETNPDNLIKEKTYAHWFPKKSKKTASTGSKGLGRSGTSRGPCGLIKLKAPNLNLSDNQKRWIVVGICLNKTLLPHLRDILAPAMIKHYDDLKAKHNIDKQNLAKHLEKDRGYNFNYGSINNNEGKKKTNPLFDFEVKSEVDLGKLYLKPFMAKFTGFDDTCDLSAVLGILSSASVFSSDVRDWASKVRQHVRNEWGHCSFLTWDEAKFMICFRLMDSLVRELKLPSDEEKRITDELKDWKARGVDLCMGNSMDADGLLEFIQYGEGEIERLSQEVERLGRSQKEEAKRITEALLSIREALAKDKKEIYKRIEALEEKVEEHDKSLEAHDQSLEAHDKTLKAHHRSLESLDKAFEAHEKAIEEIKIAVNTKF